jgi:glycopeptide antibiotics resistance protein
MIPFVCSASIEAIQYIAGIGFCEVDDVISNGFGGLIGYELSQAVSLFASGYRRKSLQSQGLQET